MRRLKAAWEAFLNPPTGQHEIVVEINSDAVVEAIRRRQRRLGKPPNGLA